MLNDTRGPIGKLLHGIPSSHREQWFIVAQFGEYAIIHGFSKAPAEIISVYSCVFMLPPAVLFIHSPHASAAFLIIIFSVSAWNGANFYVEVFGRKSVSASPPSPNIH